MSEILHANIFFLIASLATVVFCILVSLVLYQLLKIMQSIRAIMARIEMQSEQIADDIDAMRDFVRKGSVVSTLLGLFAGSSERRRRRTRSKNHEDDDIEL